MLRRPARFQPTGRKALIRTPPPRARPPRVAKPADAEPAAAAADAAAAPAADASAAPLEQQQQQQQQQQGVEREGPLALASLQSLDDGDSVPLISVTGIRMARRTHSPRASLSSPGASLDGADVAVQDILGDQGLGSEVYTFTEAQAKIIEELRDDMVGCSNAFFGVALASVALSVAAAQGVEVAEAPAVLFSGVTVGDLASWADSLLVAGLMRFGAESFTRVLDTRHREKQLAYTFQGINRLGMVFEQLAVAASMVSIVTTLEAAAEWPPLVTVASGLFFGAALLRSAAMWFVLSKYGKKLDNVEEALQVQRRCVQAAHCEATPLVDRLAIRVAFNYLLQFEAAGRRPGEQALAEGGRVPAQLLTAYRPASPAAGAGPAGGAHAAGAAPAPGGLLPGVPGVQSVKDALKSGVSQVLPIISRSTDGSESSRHGGRHGSGHGHGHGGGEAGGGGGACEAGQQAGRSYDLTPEEERLVQAFQSSLNSAGLALVLQAFATGLLVTASLATDHVGGAVTDGIQVVNKAIAAELVFVATANLDQALYSEGCDVQHLLQGLGPRGLSRLFHNLALLAWAVVLAKVVSLAAPWQESSPLYSYLNEVLGHKAGDILLEFEEILVRFLP